MKLILLVLFVSATSHAMPSKIFDCTFFGDNSKVTNRVKIFEEYSNKKSFIQIGDSKMKEAGNSSDGATVTYTNSLASLSLANQGGTGRRFDGSIRFSDNGEYYTGKDKVYDISCEYR